VYVSRKIFFVDLFSQTYKLLADFLNFAKDQGNDY